MNVRSEKIADVITRCATLVKSRLHQYAYLSSATHRAEDHHNTLQSLEPSTTLSERQKNTNIAVRINAKSTTQSSSQHQIAQTMDANNTQQHRAPEITENSLLKLLVQDLFAQQQDSEEVRNIIQGSEKLQKYMFLVLPHKPPEPWTIIQRYGKWAFKLVVDDNNGNFDTELAMPVTLNPLLRVDTPKPYRAKCIQRTYWGKRWHNEHARMVAQNQAIDKNASLLASCISDPPCREVVVSFDFRVDCPRSTTRPELHPHSGSVRNVTVTSQTGLTLGMLLEGALDAPESFGEKTSMGQSGHRECAM